MSTEPQRSRCNFCEELIDPDEKFLHLPTAEYGDVYAEDIDVCLSCILSGKYSFKDLRDKIAAQQGEEE